MNEAVITVQSKNMAVSGEVGPLPAKQMLCRTETFHITCLYSKLHLL